MPSRTVGRKFSFNFLDADGHNPLKRLVSEPLPAGEADGSRSPRRRRKHRAAKQNKKKIEAEISASDDLSILLESSAGRSPEVGNGHCMAGVGLSASEYRSSMESICKTTLVEPALENSSQVSCVSFSELRQRNGNGSLAEGLAEEATSTRGQWKPESDGNVPKLVKEGHWKASHSRETSFIGKLPLKYFVGEIYGGSSLSSTISAGNEKKRQRVYNTMFHVPWRCERLIVAGFFVCLDSFLSLLTIMPARIAMAVWRVLKTRRFWRPSAAELSDYGCFIVLGFGVTSLKLVDISLIYHFIRGQGTVKLYVVYNILEIFDKLCQSFGEDVLQVLFDSAERLSTCPSDIVKFELIIFIFDEAIAIIAFVVHSFVLLAQAITLSTCIMAHNNALLSLLVSNNFAELKSNVFKRVSKENLHNLVYYDIVERFHITAFVLFVLAQNLLEADGPWFGSFLTNVFTVCISEVFVDGIKHSFLARFNEIKPIAYSEFLEDLSEQTLNEKPDERRKDLSFIPLAPACVVIRVLTPLYANLLPCGPLHQRLLWIFLWSGLTYVMLAIWKILVGSSLRRLATWYLNLRRERKQHMD